MFGWLFTNRDVGGLFRPDFTSCREPVLVASTDGVGTKVKVGIETGRHDTCGADLVNHCVNDILVQGARPLFFLDYVVMGRLDPAVLKAVMEGIVRGCRENGTALLGGETAEMPGICAAGDYDVAVDFENALEVSWKLNVRDIVVDYRPGVGMRLSPHFSPEDSKLDHAFAAIPPHR